MLGGCLRWIQLMLHQSLAVLLLRSPLLEKKRNEKASFNFADVG